MDSLLVPEWDSSVKASGMSGSVAWMSDGGDAALDDGE